MHKYFETLQKKKKIERVPAGNRGQSVKIAHLEFGGNEPVHQSWCFFKTLGLWPVISL